MSASNPSSTSGSGSPAREALNRLPGDLAEILVRVIAASDADQLEALRQGALMRQVVKRGEQLAVCQIAGGAEDHERRRMHGQALEPLDERILSELFDGHSVHLRSPAVSTPAGLTRATAFA